MTKNPELTYCFLLSLAGCATGFGGRGGVLVANAKNPSASLKSSLIRLWLAVGGCLLLGMIAIQAAIALKVLAPIPSGPPLEYVRPWIGGVITLVGGALLCQYDSRYWSILRPKAAED